MFSASNCAGDIDVVERCDGLDFLFEPQQCLWVVDELRVDYLDGDRPLHPHMFGLIHGAHAATSQDADDTVLRLGEQIVRDFAFAHCVRHGAGG